MLEAEAHSIIKAAEELQDRTGALITAIDSVKQQEEKKALRKSFAELIGFIEEKFVFEIRMGRTKK